MIAKVINTSTADGTELQILCRLDDGTRLIENTYVVFPKLVVSKSGKERTKIVVALKCVGQCVTFDTKGNTNDYIKNDITDCIRIFRSVFRGKVVYPYD